MVRRGQYLPSVTDDELREELGLDVGHDAGLVHSGWIMFHGDELMRPIKWWATQLVVMYPHTTATFWLHMAAQHDWVGRRSLETVSRGEMTLDQAQRIHLRSVERDAIGIAEIGSSIMRFLTKQLEAALKDPDPKNIDRVIAQVVNIIKLGQTTRKELLTVREAIIKRAMADAEVKTTAQPAAQPQLTSGSATIQTPAALPAPATPSPMAALPRDKIQSIARLLLAKPKPQVGTIDDEDEEELNA